MRKNIRLVGFGLLILVILFLIVLLISQINKIPAVIEGYSTWLKIGAIIGISCISCITAQFVLSERHIETPFTPDDENYVNEMYYATAENNNELKNIFSTAIVSFGTAKSACCWLPATRQQSNNWCLACVSSTGLKATAPC